MFQKKSGVSLSFPEKTCSLYVSALSFHLAASKKGFPASYLDVMVSSEMFEFVPFKPPELGVLWLQQHLCCCTKPGPWPGPHDNALDGQGEHVILHSFRNLTALLPAKSHFPFGI